MSPLCCTYPRGWGDYDRLFTDILSYIRIPLILLVSQLFLCPDYVATSQGIVGTISTMK